MTDSDREKYLLPPLDSKYCTRFDDDRAFEFLPSISSVTVPPFEFDLPSGLHCQVDDLRSQINATNGDRIQLVYRSSSEGHYYILLLQDDFLTISVSRRNAASFLYPLPRDITGREVFEVEEIGSPICYDTKNHDRDAGVERPKPEQLQILTNGNKFHSRNQQDRLLRFLKEVTEAVGNPISVCVGSRRRKECIFRLSDGLQKKLRNGDFCNGL